MGNYDSVPDEKDLLISLFLEGLMIRTSQANSGDEDFVEFIQCQGWLPSGANIKTSTSVTGSGIRVSRAPEWRRRACSAMRTEARRLSGQYADM